MIMGWRNAARSSYYRRFKRMAAISIPKIVGENEKLEVLLWGDCVVWMSF